MERIKKVAIIGVGLLGSSLGLALKRFTEVTEIYGYDRQKKHLATALEIGAIDKKFMDFENGLAEVDLVVLAVPVAAITDTLLEIQPKLTAETIVTDVGSTKSELVAELKLQLDAKLTYIPGHPMTGSEVSGPAGADAYLFENAIYVLTPLEDTEQEKLALLEELLEKVGAILMYMEPNDHDRVVAAVSHLPHLVACALVDSVGELAKTDERAFFLAAGGFRDTTRIAAGDPTMWSDICLNNVEYIVEMLENFKQKLVDFSALLTESDYQQLFDKFASIKDLREEIPKKQRGLLPPAYELVLTIPDRPNAIAKVTSLIGEAGINITDIEILRVREKGGSLRLAFATAGELKAAEELLIGAEYKVELK